MSYESPTDPGLERMRQHFEMLDDEYDVVPAIGTLVLYSSLEQSGAKPVFEIAKQSQDDLRLYQAAQEITYPYRLIFASKADNQTGMLRRKNRRARWAEQTELHGARYKYFFDMSYRPDSPYPNIGGVRMKVRNNIGEAALDLGFKNNQIENVCLKWSYDSNSAIQIPIATGKSLHDFIEKNMPNDIYAGTKTLTFTLSDSILLSVEHSWYPSSEARVSKYLYSSDVSGFKKIEIQQSSPGEPTISEQQMLGILSDVMALVPTIEV